VLYALQQKSITLLRPNNGRMLLLLLESQPSYRIDFF
jgi:hypothetical protein